MEINRVRKLVNELYLEVESLPLELPKRESNNYLPFMNTSNTATMIRGISSTTLIKK